MNKFRGPQNRHSLVRTLAQQAARRPALSYTLRSYKMHQPRRLRLTASIVLCFVLQVLGAEKYTDENKPYEFGFKIDGEQHRHESKDKDGIIMGEFGFVADDVYHVTMYATDKEGRFKILSIKNIHLKPSSASSLASTAARQGHALALPPAQPASLQASSVSSGNNNLYAGAGHSGSTASVPDAGNYANGNGQQAGSPGQSSYPQGGAGERTAKQYNGPRQQLDSQLGPNGSQGPGAAQGQRGSTKPTLFYPQMQIVDKNTDINALGPNEQKGFAQGNMTKPLLYPFKTRLKKFLRFLNV